MSKRVRIKIDKIRANASLDELTKQSLISEIIKETESKSTKRSKMDSFRDSEAYIEPDRKQTADNKVNSSSLWNDAERSFLEDVTMELEQDDDAKKTIKGQTAMRWDAKKKRYMLKKVDRDGRVIAEKRNESGAKITNKMKDKKESIFKKWQQRTHLSL